MFSIVFYFRATEEASNMSWGDGAADRSKQNGMRPQMDWLENDIGHHGPS